MTYAMEITQNLAPYLFLPPALRRPDVTLTLPAYTSPPPLRRPVPATYGPREDGDVKKLFRRGRHRMSWRMRLAEAIVGGRLRLATA